MPLSGIRGNGAKYLSIGYLLYIDGHTILQALPFDATKLEAKGPAFPLLDGISSFDISRTGTLICRRSRSNARALKWIDKQGAQKQYWRRQHHTPRLEFRQMARDSHTLARRQRKSALGKASLDL